MKKTIVFIHGMFQNPVSWEKWMAWFEQRGYQCLAPAWPLHEGLPAQLRQHPPAGLGDLHLQTIVDEMERMVEALPEKPILIGHSVGGLVVQLLVAKGLAELGVPISSVAPNTMLSFDWGFMKNSMLITNPLKGNDPFHMDLDSFQQSFCNCMSAEETKAAYELTATHDSRNVLRDCMGKHGQVDLDLPHAPLLFVAGKEDQIIPYELVEKNAKAYKDEVSIADYRVYPNRCHFICGQTGWEEIAADIHTWLQKHEQYQYHAPGVNI